MRKVGDIEIGEWVMENKDYSVKESASQNITSKHLVRESSSSLPLNLDSIPLRIVNALGIAASLASGQALSHHSEVLKNTVAAYKSMEPGIQDAIAGLTKVSGGSNVKDIRAQGIAGKSGEIEIG
jgi:hypothetical protein